MKITLLFLCVLFISSCGNNEQLTTKQENALNFLRENRSIIENATFEAATSFRIIKINNSLQYKTVKAEHFFDLNEENKFNLIFALTDCGLNEIPESDERNKFSPQTIDYSIGFEDIKNISEKESIVDDKIYYILSMYYEKVGVKRTETDYSLSMCDENIDLNFSSMPRTDRSSKDTLFMLFDSETRLNDFRVNIEELIK